MSKQITDFGSELSFAIAILGISQTNLAKKLGVSRSAVTQYMHEKNIGLKTMRRIAEGLNCEVQIRVLPKKH